MVTARLTAQPVTLDLGGQTVSTWAYGDTAPGPLLRVDAGDVLRVDVANQLPDATSVHWHGLALRNDMDGVPGLTQDPIAAGETFRYEFTAPHPGTYFYHPHSGVQLDRGLYGVLVVDDPQEPGEYDAEWIVVLDDWVDGTGRTPDQVLSDLQQAGGDDSMGGMHDMGGMGMEGMDHGQMGAGGMAAMSREMVMENGEYSDRAFIDSMVPHHQGAVDMAKTEQADGSYEPAIELAGEIVDGQTAEIETMESLLR